MRSPRCGRLCNRDAGYRYGQIGGLAEYICVSASALFVRPEGVAPEVGASFFANYLTALYSLSAWGKLRQGETLLGLGAAGGVGIAVVQVAKLWAPRS